MTKPKENIKEIQLNTNRPEKDNLSTETRNEKIDLTNETTTHIKESTLTTNKHGNYKLN